MKPVRRKVRQERVNDVGIVSQGITATLCGRRTRGAAGRAAAPVRVTPAAATAATAAEVPDPPAPVCRSAPPGSRAGSFLIVFMGHSGSTALLSELGQHSATHVSLPEPVDHEPYQRNTTAALAYTREFFTAGRAKGLVPGFKIRPWHIEQDPDAWRALTEEFDTRLIWNFRVNVLKASVGEYTARYLNDTSVIEGLRPGTEADRCSTGAGCRFAVRDMDFLHSLMRMFVSSDRRIAAAVEALQESGDGKPRRCVLTAPYEEYLLSRRVVMRQVHTFLGLGDEDHRPNRAKATNDSLCEAVTNWADVCNAFYGCVEWRWMFDDARNGCKCRGVETGGRGKKYCSM